MNRANESAFETVIEQHLLANGYVSVHRDGFDRERAIFPEEALAFIRETQPAEWAKLEALHGARTGEEKAIVGQITRETAKIETVRTNTSAASGYSKSVAPRSSPGQ